MDELERQGYVIEVQPGGVPMAVYYDPKTGEPTQPMPCDPFNMQHLLSKGFTLTPPKKRKTRVYKEGK